VRALLSIASRSRVPARDGPRRSPRASTPRGPKLYVSACQPPPARTAPRRASRCATQAGVPPFKEGSCDCRPRYQAQVYSARDRKTLRKTFRSLSDARAWRWETQTALNRGTVRAPSRTTLDQAAGEWLQAAETGVVRTRSGISTPVRSRVAGSLRGSAPSSDAITSSSDRFCRAFSLLLRSVDAVSSAGADLARQAREHNGRAGVGLPGLGPEAGREGP